ncbi:hypothetical protein LYNGBM3L_18020 [Moorena producens 3L]|uniref:Uncharacterized protein n=1 Tax=Moorena producens 3L TaxID=489825 RepID=F4XM05_9CYAN|nr:hypothetical protein LYNGBM3L_18020 [Moorena producens 3L]OLT65566.1 hypothetical protein BI334_11460 [Moorena producens 3L]
MDFIALILNVIVPPMILDHDLPKDTRYRLDSEQNQFITKEGFLSSLVKYEDKLWFLILSTVH